MSQINSKRMKVGSRIILQDLISIQFKNKQRRQDSSYLYDGKRELGPKSMPCLPLGCCGHSLSLFHLWS
jgi:hypothetical protein